MSTMSIAERFAPSPTGRLHLGHAFSAITAHDAARAAGGRFLLRFEDIDHTRCRPEHEAGMLADLSWLDLTWDAPPLRQSERLNAYEAALGRLSGMGLLYPCTCTRRDIAAALSAPQEGDGTGPDGRAYPGTCRDRTRPPEGPHALRLRMDRAVALTGAPEFADLIHGTQTRSADWMTGTCGDIVLARRDIGASYHLSVVLDDAWQGISHVTRGEDLLTATFIHVVLQRLLNLPHTVYRHHRLIRDEAGRRLAKRDDARSLAQLRAEGAGPDDIRRMVGL